MKNNKAKTKKIKEAIKPIIQWSLEFGLNCAHLIHSDRSYKVTPKGWVRIKDKYGSK